MTDIRATLGNLPSVAVPVRRVLERLSLLGRRRRRFVMIVGDEGAVLVQVAGRQVTGTEYVPLPDPDGADQILRMLRSDRSASVTVLVDLLEQHYRETTIPNVGLFDERKLLKRKLNQTFGDDHLTSYVKLRERDGEGGSRDRKFLLIGVPYEGDLKSWIGIVVRGGNPVTGISLMPIELVGFMRAISVDRHRRGHERARWEVLITRERAGGFRQVIVHKDRLVFTRLTQNLEPDASVADQVENLESEFRSTLSYLRRLSFSDADSIDLTIVADQTVAQQIDARRMRVREARCVDTATLAHQLDLAGAGDPDDPYADRLIAAWQAQNARSRLSLTTPDLTRSRMTALVPKVAAAGAAAVLLFAGIDLARQYAAQSEVRSELSEMQPIQRGLQGELDRLSASLGNFDVELSDLSAVVRGHDALAAGHLAHVKIVRTLAVSLPADMAVVQLRIEPLRGEGSVAATGLALLDRAERGRSGPGGANGDRPMPRAEMTATFGVLLNAAADGRDSVMRRFEAVQAQLAEMLPQYEVTIQRDPFSSDASGRLSGAVGQSNQPSARADNRRLVATFRIVGPKPEEAGS